MRAIVGLKRFAVLGCLGITLVSAACDDDGDEILNGGGTGGDASEGGKSSGGSNAGTTTGGSTAGKGGGSNAGTAGTTNAGAAGATSMGGAAGQGGGPIESMAGSGAGQGGGLEMGGAAGEGGVGGEGGAGGAIAFDVLENPGFETWAETGVPGWTVDGTPPSAAYAEFKQESARSGFARLAFWTADSDYTASAYQTVSPIPNGTYSFSIWVERGTAKEQYLFARGFNAGDPSEEKKMVTDAAGDSAYVKITLSDIPVTSGSVTVGVYSSAWVNNWVNFDDAELVLTP